MGTSTGRLGNPVAGHPQDQIMGRSRDGHKTSTKHVFQIPILNTSNLLWQIIQDLIANGSSENFSEKYSR